ncbi:MAG TPA: hypothetical protein VL092_08985 [Chitinophagaceae bacterium]|nr:hypothetical protein [Chitinophagaceae bacterium]
MNHDKQLRKTFDEASVADLVPSFDPDAGWHDVSKRLKPQRKQVSLSRYLPYVAAVAAVLILLLRQKDSSSLTLVAFRSVPAQQAERQAGQAVAGGGALLAHDDQVRNTVPVSHPEAAPASAVPAPAPSLQDTTEIIVAVAVSEPQKVSLPVKHYTDIVPVHPVAEDDPVVSRQKKGFWHSRIARRRVTPQTDIKEEAPIRGLIYALNQQ